MKFNTILAPHLFNSKEVGIREAEEGKAGIQKPEEIISKKVKTQIKKKKKKIKKGTKPKKARLREEEETNIPTTTL
ncbi:hypothetical protein XENTR_v10002894 [Xenopus tropicalis]|nr:hypothetical protein XENTR_v10002894 [Xenopus tropicalis]